MTNRQVLLLVVVLVGVPLLPCAAAVLLGLAWLLWPAGPMPAPGPTLVASDFYIACQDLDGVQRRAAAAGGFTLGAVTSSDGHSRGGPGWVSERAEQARAVECRPEDRGKILAALKAEVERLARADGATIRGTETAEAKDQAGPLRSFALQYTAGGGHGTVTAVLGEGKPVPGKAGVESYPLTVQVEESVP